MTIPAAVIFDVREGLFCLMGDATQGLDQALVRPDRELHPEWFEADRELLGRAFALLDVIGWSAGSEPAKVDVDVGQHGGTLKDALDGYLPLLEDQEKDADIDDRRRAAEGKPLRKQEISNRLLACREFAALLERRVRELA